MFRLIINSTAVNAAPIPKKICQENKNTLTEVILQQNTGFLYYGFISINLALVLFQMYRQNESLGGLYMVITQPEDIFRVNSIVTEPEQFNTTLVQFLGEIAQIPAVQKVFDSPLLQDEILLIKGGGAIQRSYYDNPINFNQDITVYFAQILTSTCGAAEQIPIIIVNNYVKCYANLSLYYEEFKFYSSLKLSQLFFEAADSLDELESLPPTLQEYYYSELPNGLIYLRKFLDYHKVAYSSLTSGLVNVLHKQFIQANL